MKKSEVQRERYSSLSSIYRNWQAEDRTLKLSIDAIRQWMYEVSQFGNPHFGETATRLRPLRSDLIQHFQREDEMLTEISKSHLTSTQKVDSMREQSLHDRDSLFAELDDLMDRLNQLDPPFSSWQRAMDEVEGFIDQLGKHERREVNSMTALIPDSELD